MALTVLLGAFSLMLSVDALWCFLMLVTGHRAWDLSRFTVEKKAAQMWRRAAFFDEVG